MILSKIAESYIKDYIYAYLEATNFLCEEQHGFRAHRSCTTQLLLLSDILSKRIDSGLCTDIVYLDFQKAFDKVPHKRLLLKLKAAGIQGPIYNFIEDFLSHRTHRIKVNGSLSSKSSVKSGILQGSILGPLLFIIFINDLPSEIKNHCLMFADDTKIVGAPGHDLQIDVNHADNWARQWQINFNVGKCKVLHFNQDQDEYFEYEMRELNTMCKIVSTNHDKDIGVTFDNNLLFNSHISSTVKKCQSILSIIKRTVTFLDENIMAILYTALVRPVLEYSNVIWAPHLAKHIIMIGAVQRRATRMVPTLTNMCYKDRLTKIDMFSLAYRRRRGDLIQVYKLLHNVDNVKADYLFHINDSITRGHDLKLKKEHCRTNTRKFSFSQRVINDWNSLPQQTVHAANINVFKNCLDIFFADKLYEF